MVDLGSPAARREVLRAVDVNDPRPGHAVLRELFDRERAWREGLEDGADDEFEQIYLAAFLLFLIGDPAAGGRATPRQAAWGRAECPLRQADVGSRA